MCFLTQIICKIQFGAASKLDFYELYVLHWVPTQPCRRRVFQAGMIQLLILHFLCTFHSTAILFTPPKGSISKGYQSQSPAQTAFVPTNTLLRERRSCESYKESESKIPHEYYAGIRRKRCKWFPRAPPVLMTISYILGKSQQI